MIDFLTHWSLVGAFVLVFAAGAYAAWLEHRADKRRRRRFVRPVPPGRGNARLARENARFRTGVPR